MIILNIIIVIVGLGLLYKGADWMLKSSIYIAEKTGIPKFIIGATVVAVGTSIPELIINILSSLQGRQDIIIGNVLGSNISNILLVLGIAAIITPIRVKKLVATRDIPFSIASIFIFGLLSFDVLLGEGTSNSLTASDGLVFLIMFLIFLYYVAFSHQEHREEIKSYSVKAKVSGYMLLGLLGLISLIGGDVLVVENSILIAERLGISERVIGLTVISIGTSLPELVTIIVSINKGETDIGVGNIIGSNIVNLLLILGASVVIKPITNIAPIGLDVFMLLLATSLLIASLFLGKRNKVDRTEGFFFVIIYLVYMLSLFS